MVVYLATLRGGVEGSRAPPWHCEAELRGLHYQAELGNEGESTTALPFQGVVVRGTSNPGRCPGLEAALALRAESVREITGLPLGNGLALQTGLYRSRFRSILRRSDKNLMVGEDLGIGRTIESMHAISSRA